MTSRLRRPAVDADLRTRSVGRNFIYRLRTTSTMDDARAAAVDGAPSGTVVFAEEQTAGRGRLTGRRWVSPAGQNLYFTIVVRPSVAQLQRLSMLTPVAVANAVEQVHGLYPRIKWPNDLHLKGKKFAGILIDSEWQASKPQFALVGVGVNVNFDPRAHTAEIAMPATSLALERGKPVPREPILAAILTAFERAYDGALSPAVVRGWRLRLETLGKRITLSETGGSFVQGVAEDVTDDGGLVLRTDDGATRVFHAGEVTLRPASANAARVDVDAAPAGPA